MKEVKEILEDIPSKEIDLFFCGIVTNKAFIPNINNDIVQAYHNEDWASVRSMLSKSLSNPQTSFTKNAVHICLNIVEIKKKMSQGSKKPHQIHNKYRQC